MLGNFRVVPLCAVSNKKLESLHLCEAPGAFVCALNHYLILNYPGLNVSCFLIFTHKYLNLLLKKLDKPTMM